jgi:hypothetical protein
VFGALYNKRYIDKQRFTGNPLSNYKTVIFEAQGETSMPAGNENGKSSFMTNRHANLMEKAVGVTFCAAWIGWMLIKWYAGNYYLAVSKENNHVTPRIIIEGDSSRS